MANGEKEKGLRGRFQGVADSVRTAVKDLKVPEIKLPSGVFQARKKPEEPPAAPKPKHVTVRNALKIFYYMMAADGEFASAEEERFAAIGTELDPDFETSRQAITDECRAQMQKAIDPDDRFDALRDGVDDAIGSSDNAIDGVVAPRLLVWDLLTIAYSDKDYDPLERKLLKHVVRKFDVDKAVFLEMENSMQAIMELEAELAWIEDMEQPFLVKKALSDEIANRRDTILNSMYDLIAL